MVTLVHTRTPAEAQVVAAMLRAHGIPCYVPGENLQDEFAVSQRALGVLGTEVQVPAAALEAARRLLEEARGEGGKLDAGDPEC